MLRFTPLLVVLCWSMVGSSPAYSQAYCALRDPTKQIYEAYPMATSFRSIVRTVDESVRQKVAGELPFTIHFNELGKHTLYVAVRDDRPLGLIHARSEKGKWGLVEVAWSLDPSLRVRDFSFQRCRARQRTAVETNAFKEQIVGKGKNELRAMLSSNGNSLAPGGIKISSGAEDLAVTILRSALKTIAVTQLVWAKDLQLIRPLYYTYHDFPRAARVERFDDVYSPRVQQQIDQEFAPADESTIDRDAVTMLVVYGRSGQVIGRLIRTPWHSLGRETVVWWAVSEDLVIQNVFAEEDWPDAEVKGAFVNLKGMSMDRVHDCSTATEVVGAEVLVLCLHN